MAIVWDAATTDVPVAAASTRSINHTVGGGTNRCAWIVVWNGGTGFTISGTPTFGGVSVTEVSGSPFNATPLFTDARIFRALNPTTGVNALSVTFTGNTGASAVIISAAGVDQTTPNDALDTDTTSNHAGSTSATTASEVGDSVVDFVLTGFASGLVGNTPGAAQTVLANIRQALTGEEHNIAMSYKDGALSVTQSWDFTPVVDVSVYHLQMNVNTDSPPPPGAIWNLRRRENRPAPFKPGLAR